MHVPLSRVSYVFSYFVKRFIDSPAYRKLITVTHEYVHINISHPLPYPYNLRLSCLESTLNGSWDVIVVVVAVNVIN